MINIKTATAKLLKDQFQISEITTSVLFEKGILNEPSMKKVLIREEYMQKVREKGKQRLRGVLSEKYCVSVSLVEKSVHKTT